MSEQAANNAFNDLLDAVTPNSVSKYIPNKFFDKINQYDAINVVTGEVADWFDWAWGNKDDVKIDLWQDSTLRGYDGDDILVSAGLWGDHYQNGGSGQDFMFAVGQSVEMHGAEGNDTMLALGGYNDVHGGSGKDVIAVLGFENDIFGGDGEDIIVAVGADNDIDGGSGNDTIIAIAADNYIAAGWGNDVIVALAFGNQIYGGKHKDTITALGGGNWIYGGEDNDTIITAGGANFVEGGSGADVITAAGLYNDLDGGDGGDTIIAAAGYNGITGGAGNDVIQTNGGFNTVDANGGQDVVISLGGNNWVEGGGGADVLIGIGIANEQFGQDGDDTLVAVGNLNFQWGGANADTLVALGNNNMQWGDTGADTLFGGALLGGNIQFGGDGLDTLIAGGSANLQHGGAKADTLIGAAGGNLQVGGNGGDWLVGAGWGNVQFGDGIDEIAYIDWSGMLSDHVGDNLAGNALTKALDGLSDLAVYSSDLIDELGGQVSGSDGNDKLLAGGKGNLQMSGGGDDTLFAGGMANLQAGGSGQDTLIGIGKANLQFGESGSDLVIGIAAGYANGQFAGKGADVLIGMARGQLASAQVQHADDGNDLLLGVTMGKNQGFLAKMQAYKKIFEEAHTAQQTGDYSQVQTLVQQQFITQALTAAPTSIGVQLGGAGDDVFYGTSDAGVQLGQAGDDIMLVGGDYQYADGGAESDLLISTGSRVSVINGGADDDWLLDAGTFARFLAFTSLDEQTIADVQAVVNAALDPIEEALNVIDDVQEQIDELNPLSEIEEQAEDIVASITEWFDFGPNKFVGGAGNDVLASGGNAHMSGGVGDDTYLVTFGTGSNVIDEAGFDAVHDWAGQVDLSTNDLSALTTGGGGVDTLEVHSIDWSGFSAAQVKFETIDTGSGINLNISMLTEEGSPFPQMGDITIRNMDDTHDRIEHLILSGDDQYLGIDLADAFDSGGLGRVTMDTADEMDRFYFDVSSGLTSSFASEWGGADGWADTLETAFGRIPGFDSAFDTAKSSIVTLADTAGDLLGSVAPDHGDYLLS